MDDLFLDNAAAENAQTAENLPTESMQPLPGADFGAEASMTRSEKPRPSLFAANALYLLAGAGLMLMQLLSEPLALLIMHAFPAISAEGLLLAVNSLYYIFFLLLPVAVYAASRGSWASIRLSRPPRWRHVWRAILAAVVAVPLSSGIGILWHMFLQSFGLSIVEEGFHVPSSGLGLGLMALCLGVLPGVCEELAFRGMVLGAWERRGSVRAMLISSLMFASLHGSVAGFPTHFLLGCMIAVMAVGSGSVYTGMLFHGVYNSLLLLIQYFSQNFLPVTEEDLAAAELMQTDVVAALGGGFGVTVIVIEAALMGIAMFFLLRGIWPRREKIDLTYGEDDWESPDEREIDAVAEPDFELVPRTRGHMEWQELMVLLSAVMTALFMYGQDFLNMLGGGA